MIWYDKNGRLQEFVLIAYLNVAEDEEMED